MTFGSLEAEQDNAPLADINMVPLIDVMLVLLIIFMVTAPLLTHAVKLDLPRASSQPNVTKPDHVQLAIDKDGQVFWNAEPVDAAALADRMHAAAALQPQPELHIRADRATPYENVARTMSEAARQGLGRIGFVTEPAAP
jgi:biopolymer transport protein ExbD